MLFGLMPGDYQHGQVGVRSVQYQQVSRERYIENLTGFGVSDALAGAVADMFEAIANGLFNAEPRTPITAAQSMQQWIDDVFVPAFHHPRQ
jgi:hypothetical protein